MSPVIPGSGWSSIPLHSIEAGTQLLGYSHELSAEASSTTIISEHAGADRTIAVRHSFKFTASLWTGTTNEREGGSILHLHN